MSGRTMHVLLLASLIVGSVGGLNASGVVSALNIDIPYEKFVLDNGLTLIVHEDHKAPIVAVNVWYHVGSKNEKPGRTGFAHLFEHLMFNGSENFNDDYFQAMARIGATGLNGTTNNDRTNYFQNVPTTAVDVALWMESDRMGHLLGAVDQAKLDEQRGVVQNEKRQGENQPYAVGRELIAKHVYPEGHPYSWTVIGSMEDLDAAALEDVHEWFRASYGAANAVVVVAGDIDPQTALAKVKRYFGDIPAGPPVRHPAVWVAKRDQETREVIQDRVPHARLYRVWNVPPYKNREHDQLELVASVLAGGKTSRFYKRLVYEEQIARDVSAYVASREIGSLFFVVATAQPGVELARVEQVLDEEFARFLESGPTSEELERVKTEYFSGMIRGVERIGGFGGKSDLLALNEVYAGDAAYYKQVLQHVREATAADVKRAANTWLSSGAFNLEIQPFPEYDVVQSDVDRSTMPEAGAPPETRFVELQRDRLSNGLQLILASRQATPVVDFDLILDAGYASDAGARAGTARLAMDMLDEGTSTRNALQISEQLALLGAELSTSSNLDISQISMSALRANLGDSLELYADVILNPSFPEEEFARRQKQQLTSIESEKSRPYSMALRVFPGLLYGANHAYGMPLTGSGNSESVSALSRKDLASWHATWFDPAKATLVIVGDTTMDQIKPMLEKRFQTWKASGKTPAKEIGRVAHKTKPEIYIIDKPGAAQSLIIAGHVAPPRGSDADVAIETMNTILGGTFVARMNMNLREDKHWSYGARTILMDARGQRPFFAYAPVQTDKTKESMIEVRKELTGIVGDRPITEDELDKIKSKQVLELPGLWETNGSISRSIVELIRFDLDDNYFDKYAGRVRSLSLPQVSAAAETVVQPGNLIWVIVGDREKIEPGIRELGFGEVRFLDSDGRALPAEVAQR